MRYYATLFLFFLFISTANNAYSDVPDEGLLNSKEILSIFSEEKQSKSSKYTPEKLLSEVQDFRQLSGGMESQVLVDEWLKIALNALRLEGKNSVNRFLSFDEEIGQPVGIRSVVASLPDPELWEKIKLGNKKPKGIDRIKFTALKLLLASLNGEVDKQHKLIKKLNQLVQKQSIEAKRANLNLLEEIKYTLILADGVPEKILLMLDQKLAIQRTRPEEFEIPDLITLAGAEAAEKWLRKALVTENVFLNIPAGTKTSVMAKKLALELIDKLKVRQWTLINDLDSIALYEALVNQFQGDVTAEGYLGWQKKKALIYYFLSLIAQGQSDKAIQTIRSVGFDSEITISNKTYFELEKAGYSLQVWEFLDKTLKQYPSFPLWDAYLTISAHTGHSKEAVQVLESLLNKNASSPVKQKIKKNYLSALLGIGEIDKAIRLFEELIPELESYEKLKMSLKQAKIGRLLGKEDILNAGLKTAINVVSDQAKDTDNYSYRSNSDELSKLLRETKQLKKAQSIAVERFEAQSSQLKAYKELAGEGAGDLAISQLLRPSLIELMGIYYDAGQWNDIIELTKKFPYWGVKDITDILNEKDSRDIPVAMLIAKALAETDDGETASKLLEALLFSHPGYDPAYELYVNLNGVKSMTFINSLYKFDQFEERPLIWKAQILLDNGKIGDAEKTIKKAIGIDPSDGEQGKGDRMRAYSILADILEAQNKIEQANLYRNAVQAIRLSENADDYHALSLFDTAIEKYKIATEQFSDAYCIQSRLAIQLTRRGRHEEAVEHYRKAFELMPDSFGRIESHCFGCETVFAHPEAQSIAEDVFLEILEKRPTNAQVYYMLGYLRKEQRNYNGAIQNFRHAIGLDPEYLSAWKQLYLIGNESFLAGWEHDIAALKMMELDPLQRHVSVDFKKITDLRGLWEKSKIAYEIYDSRPKQVYKLFNPAKATNKENDKTKKMTNIYKAYYSSGTYSRAPIQPAKALMETTIIFGALNLIEPDMMSRGGFY